MILPNRGMKLTIETDEFLRRLKGRTKVTPNVLARIAFFTSVEAGNRYNGEPIELNGSLSLDKVTWLGETGLITEMTLQMLYPDNDQQQNTKAWAYHVMQGSKSFRNVKNIDDLVIA
ncbi:MAG: DNA sulfur modification protein DndE [Pseudoalteromonas prydzensis]|uniref:DNA sulfur modification protein DndE n=1 Tax=Pseudoalteromonas TaxID=53246 RepID=UPI001C71A538|nr:DNA sulfur modification protein DndE [Pseudoalteromonas sp. SG43-6]